MPLLFSTRHKSDLPKLQGMLDCLTVADKNGDAEAFDVVIKPTHLSNAAGTLMYSKEKWLQDGRNAGKILQHMDKYLAERADDKESEALKSLIPGFIAQPRYKSCVEFQAPLELRVISLWGKARLGIWWWGRQQSGTTVPSDRKAHRSAWIVRKNESQLSENREGS